MSPAVASDAPVYVAKAGDAAIWLAKATDALANSPLVKAVTLSKSPVGYWRLNETSGLIAKDSSGNGRDAAINATGVTLGTLPLLPGDPADPGMTFDGVNGIVSAPGNGLGFAGATPFSLHVWVSAAQLNHAGGGSNATILEKPAGGASGRDNYRLWVGATSIINFRWRDSTDVDESFASAAGAVPLNTLCAIGLRWDGTHLVCFNNNVKVINATPTHGPFTVDTRSLTIGDTALIALRNWDGPIKDAAVFGAALSDADFSDLYLVGKTALGALAVASDARV